jgi:LPPG:FO 2-phospho-L-lactate transferase
VIRNKVLALSGGIGGAKLGQGLSLAFPADELVIVANTGDDFEHLGLYVSPDTDTLLYTLAGISNPATGWGRAEETWSCMTELRALGGEVWFQLGDKDLALHLYRTARLTSGATLSAVTDELRRSLKVRTPIVPMCEQPVRTHLETDRGFLPFQHYFVRDRCEPRVQAVHYVGSNKARLSTAFDEALRNEQLSAIIFCPSNPYLSIGPILAIPGVRDGIRRSRCPVIAVSPIVEGQALKGPTGKLMAELGIPVSAEAVAAHYSGLVDGLVLDRKDASSCLAIEKMGMHCYATNTIMQNLEDRIQLARDVMSFADSLVDGRGALPHNRQGMGAVD